MNNKLLNILLAVLLPQAIIIWMNYDFTIGFYIIYILSFVSIGIISDYIKKNNSSRKGLPIRACYAIAVLVNLMNTFNLFAFGTDYYLYLIAELTLGMLVYLFFEIKQYKLNNKILGK